MDRAGGRQRDDLRRPWWLWAGTFAVFLSVLLLRNSFVFTTRLYEMADQAANSILIEQARRMELLVGDYSRLGFNHPGPAYLYVRAAGESLFYDVLHVVPTPWNGQLIAVYMLNSAFAAMGVAVVYGWTRSPRGAAAALAVIAVLAALHPQSFSSDWMSHEYTVPYLVFLIASASVAAGRAEDAWIMALTGWFLIHGQACFLLFVPIVGLAVAATVVWRIRRSPLTAVRTFLAVRRAVWLPPVAISALFILPIAVNLALHWPGDFGKYLTYSRTGSPHKLRSAVLYALWFWWPHHHALVLPLVLFPAAGLVAWLLADGQFRLFLLTLLGVAGLSTAAMVYYAMFGIDRLSSLYIGYFEWAVPVIPVLVIAVTVAVRLPELPGTALAAGAATVAVAAFVLAPYTRTSTLYSDPGVRSSNYDTDPRLPAALSLMAARSPRRPLVIHVGPHTTWPSMTGLLIISERAGLSICVAGPFWEFMVTGRFICTLSQVAHGANYNLEPLIWPHRHALIVLRMGWLTPRTGPMTPPGSVTPGPRRT